MLPIVGDSLRLFSRISQSLNCFLNIPQMGDNRIKQLSVKLMAQK